MKSILLFTIAAAFNSLDDGSWQSDWNGQFLFKEKASCNSIKDTCTLHCARFLSVNANVSKEYQVSIYSVNALDKNCPCNQTNGFYFVLGGKPMDGYQAPNSNTSVSINPNTDGSVDMHVNTDSCQVTLHKDKRTNVTSDNNGNATTTKSGATFVAVNGLLILGLVLLV
ncbi:hypothetical protein HDV06_000374 [Boothiomyces sp. JEL0866]|nr:hypothetical protein HDV06_000374 [Boothiomyces sp. JEL0866]